jgi:hypothetical protein
MNALFGAAIKGFLTLMQAENAVRQNHGDGAQGSHRGAGWSACHTRWNRKGLGHGHPCINGFHVLTDSMADFLRRLS